MKADLAAGVQTGTAIGKEVRSLGNEYVFATAFIRSEEKHLLTNEDFKLMLEAASIEDVCKVLQDAGYGSDKEMISSSNYERLLKKKEDEIFSMIRTLAGSNEVFDVFSLTSDYHNIKTLLKAESLGTERNDIMLQTGSIPAEKMTELVRERDRAGLTENMYNAIFESLDALARTKDPQKIDFICDKYCFKDILCTADNSENEFIKGLVGLKIDIINIKTLARLKMMGKPVEYYRDIFIEGGNIEKPIYIDAYEEDFEQLAQRFAEYDIYNAVSRGFEELAEKGTFTMLEKLCDDAVMDYALKAKNITFGIEAPAAYIVYKQTEIQCVRILMSGRLAGMEPEAVRERLRETYE